MYVLVKDCKTKEEAIEKSGMKVGQFIRIKTIHAHGNVKGVWTVIPRIELILEESGDVLQKSMCQEREQ